MLKWLKGESCECCVFCWLLLVIMNILYVLWVYNVAVDDYAAKYSNWCSMMVETVDCQYSYKMSVSPAILLTGTLVYVCVSMF